MALLNWVSEYWPSVIQNLGIIGGLGFTAYSLWKDERARRVANYIAISGQYREIWSLPFHNPELVRVLEADVDLNKTPVTAQEEIFVNQVIVHLDIVRRAIKAGVFVKMDGLRKDVRDFFSLPIPRAVFEKNKPLQDKDFIKFMDCCFAARNA